VVRSPLVLSRRSKRKYFPVRPDAEKTLPARIATIRSKSQHPLYTVLSDVASRNSIEVKHSAAGAMCIEQERDRHDPCIKTRFAGLTTPGPESKYAENKIGHAAAA
jgi:hypothetical protein